MEPKTKADQEKMGVALGRLAQEDPSFRVRTDEESGQTIISGMGELHLEIIVDRMKREFSVEANVGKPQVAYREAIKKTVESRGQVHQADRAARVSTGTCGSSSSRTRPGKGYEFVDAIKGGSVPREYIPAVQKGVADSLTTACWPAIRWSTSRSPCSTAPTTRWTRPSRRSRWPGSIAFKDGMRKASPVLLEPMMAVEVETPEDFMGNVVGDLSSRRGMIQGMDDQIGGIKVVKAEVPLAEMFGYSTTLRSLTQGRATYTMEFKHYAEAPKSVAGRDHQPQPRQGQEVRKEPSWRKESLSAPSRT